MEQIAKEKESMMRQAMKFGALLGLFWMFKYAFMIGSGFSDHVFIFIYYVLNIVTFLAIYILYFKYRDANEHPKKMWECIKFILTVCFFASILESVLVFAHYTFIHPEFFYSKMQYPMTKLVQSLIKEPNRLETASLLANSKSLYIAGRILANVALGFFLSLCIGLITPKKKDV